MGLYNDQIQKKHGQAQMSETQNDYETRRTAIKGTLVRRI
jgi:hypothetical protein